MRLCLKSFETRIFNKVSFLIMFSPFSTTGIGSLPHKSVDDACRLVLGTFDIPFWPQLPALSFREFMVPQYAEGMPFVRIDEARQSIWIERDSSDELDRFYESWSEDSKIAISEDCARGLHAFLRLIRTRQYDVVKGHITGPLTFTLGLKDSGGRPIYFDEELREIALMLLKAKIRWQVDVLKSGAGKVLIFIDEPILSALGSSSYLGVGGEDALRLLKETVSAVRDAGAIPGIHCCGNADWLLVLKSGAGVVNFDAYDYLDTIALYPEELGAFLKQGGFLAWGIVPTSEAIAAETTDSIRNRFDNGMEKLARSMPEALLKTNILLTPSCGTGSRTIEETLKIFQILIRLKESVI